jgi:hypothetical protein
MQARGVPVDRKSDRPELMRQREGGTVMCVRLLLALLVVGVYTLLKFHLGFAEVV